MKARFFGCMIAACSILTSGLAVQAQTPSANARSEIAEPTGPLTLAQAVALALARSPELEAFDWDMRAADARVVQAGAFPNPEFAAETEDFGGKGDRRGFRAADTTLTISQLIELGFKRSHRIAAADQEKLLAVRDYDAKRLDVVSATSKAFIDVLAMQSRVEFADNTANLGARMLNTAVERVKAGRASPLEESRSRVVQSTSRLELERSKRALDTARKQLAHMWGASIPSFTRADGRLDEIAPVPDVNELLRRIDASPDVARWTNEIELRQANVRIEQSKAIPDVTLQGGIRRFADTDDNAYVAGFSIPLPVFNTNRGGVAEAGAKLNRAHVEQRTARLRLEGEARAAHNAMTLAASEMEAMNQDIVPGAEQAFTAAQESYRLGRSDFLDLLDAQRTLAETKARLIDTFSEYQKAKIDIERLGSSSATNARQ